MDKKLIPSKISGVGLPDLFVAGLSKNVSERLLAQTPIGNNTFLSGVSKIALAMGVNYVAKGNSLAKSVGLGIGVDGVEDIVNNFVNMVMPSTNQNDGGFI